MPVRRGPPSPTGRTWGRRNGRGPRRRLEEVRCASGLPGGGKGRIEVVEMSGVYPGFGPYPKGDVVLRTPAEFVRGQFDEEGREIEGESGVIRFRARTQPEGDSHDTSAPPQTPKPPTGETTS